MQGSFNFKLLRNFFALTICVGVIFLSRLTTTDSSSTFELTNMPPLINRQPSQDFTTAFVKEGIFRTHGLVKVKIDGDIAHYEAWGPFNEELVAAYIQIQELVLPKMAAKGCWGDFSIFHTSVLVSQATLNKFAEDLRTMALRGLAPNATAFVIAPGVEGAQLMSPLFAKCYSDAGLPFRIFLHPDEAQTWLQSALAGATP